MTKELRVVLNAGVRSLFFNGQYDLICNHVSRLILCRRSLNAAGTVGPLRQHLEYLAESALVEWQH